LVRAIVGIGGNIGDRLAYLREAVRRLRELVAIIATSRVYQTEPVGPPQARYLNAAALVQTDFSPRELLTTLLDVERAMGRIRNERWGPRTIDLDLLWIEGVHVSEAGLEVPHPRLEERAFALVPLLDVAPDAIHPLTKMRYAEISLDRTGMTVAHATL
jgi:2-amino-4-hydroxy-6-hydroxymethyldihydropteridine diphosphokinase